VPETAITAPASRRGGEGESAGGEEWSVPPGGGGGADASHGDGLTVMGSARGAARVGLNLLSEGTVWTVRYAVPGVRPLDCLDGSRSTADRFFRNRKLMFRKVLRWTKFSLLVTSVSANGAIQDQNFMVSCSKTYIILFEL
jgi:hypothetical protein